MSRCGKSEQLEAMVMGELNVARTSELQAHSERCAVCRHELDWLESERRMFEHRRAREQVQQLWEGFAARRVVAVAVPVPKRERDWSRWALAAAAAVVLSIGLSSSQVRPQPALTQGESMMSLEEMSRDFGSTSRDCSELRPGMGFACGPYVVASFVK